MNVDIDVMKFGVNPSPPDTRDYHIAGLIPIDTQFPEEYMIPEQVTIIESQKNTLMCVAHSLALIAQLMNLKETGVRTRFSRSFIYCNRGLGDLIDDGMYPREALEHLRKEGVCLASTWDELIPNWTLAYDKITPKMREEALSYKVQSYAKVTTENEMKTALMQLGALTACIPVTDRFCGDYNSVLTQDYIDKNKYGYHEITIIGWKKYEGKNYWICVNSYGSEWGKYSGLFFLEFGYIFIEVYSITDAVNSKPIPIKPLTPKVPLWNRVQSKEFKLKKDCQALQLKINAKGFQTCIVTTTTGVKVQIGAYLNTTQGKLDAQKRVKDLNLKGFKDIIINLY